MAPPNDPGRTRVEVTAEVAADRTTMLSAATTPRDSAAFQGYGRSRTFQASGATSSGAGSATVVIEVTNFENPTNADWLTLGTITLTLGTTRTSDGFASLAAWAKYRARVSAISGTGASVDVMMGS